MSRRKLLSCAGAIVTVIPTFLAGVQGAFGAATAVHTVGWRMRNDWPIQTATVVSSSIAPSSIPNVCEEHVTYRYETHGRAFERSQTRYVSEARTSPLPAYILPSPTTPPPNSPIAIHYDPKAPAISIYQPALFQFGVLRAIFARAPVHPLQGNRLPDPPAQP